MSFPTYEAHNTSTDHRKRPFLDVYLEAKGFNKNDHTVRSLAFFTFNLVNASFRLSDISIYPQSLQALTAQEQEVAGWQAKLYRFLNGKHHLLSITAAFREDFTEMAVDSRVPTQEDRDFTALAMAGRIDEVPPEISEPFVHAWQQLGVGNEFDSGFNQR